MDHMGPYTGRELAKRTDTGREGETDRQRGTKRQSPRTVLALRKTSSRLETVKTLSD